MTVIFDKLKDEFPDLVVNKDTMSSGIVWYDLLLGRCNMTIEHRPLQGYGIYYKEDAGFGTGPDEVVQIDRLVPRLTELFKTRLGHGLC